MTAERVVNRHWQVHAVPVIVPVRPSDFVPRGTAIAYPDRNGMISLWVRCGACGTLVDVSLLPGTNGEGAEKEATCSVPCRGCERVYRAVLSVFYSAEVIP